MAPSALTGVSLPSRSSYIIHPMVSLPQAIRPARNLYTSVLRVLDACLVFSTLLVVVGWMAPWDLERCWMLGGVSLVVFFVAGEMAYVYRNWRGAQIQREACRVAMVWAATVAMLLFLGYVTGFSQTLPRRVMMTWAVCVPAALIAVRVVGRHVVRSLHRSGWNTRHCAIVGVNSLAFETARSILAAPELGLRFVGFFDDREKDRQSEIPTELGEYAGSINDLVNQAHQGQVETIYISLPMRAEDRIRDDLLGRFSDTTASVYLVPDFFVFEMLHSRWSDLGGLPVVSVFENPLYGIDGLAKRLTDLLLGTIFLLIAAVPMMLIALGIKLTSPGPVFFRQKRYGLDGKEVRVWKFRSMTVCEDGNQVTQATRNDQRITRLGAILRKTSLDEFPQLFNVLEGSMSLVGPRPHANAHNEQYRKLIPGYMLRHKVKPGITGWAQVNGWRGETNTLEKMQKRIEFDHQYIREWSLWMDIKILARTMLVAWSQNNAY